MKKLVAERLDLVPAFRRRIVEVPFGLDRPYAVDNDSLDIEFHVRQIAVPAPWGARAVGRDRGADSTPAASTAAVRSGRCT